MYLFGSNLIEWNPLCEMDYNEFFWCSYDLSKTRESLAVGKFDADHHTVTQLETVGVFRLKRYSTLGNVTDIVFPTIDRYRRAVTQRILYPEMLSFLFVCHVACYKPRNWIDMPQMNIVAPAKA